jgi:anti-sigma B factor antagonist
MSTTSDPSDVAGLEIVVSVDHDRAYLMLAGEIDVTNSEQLVTSVYRHLGEPRIVEVVADLAGLTFLDSSGLRALVLGRRRADESGKAFRIRNHRGHVANVIEITGLTPYLSGPSGEPGDVDT